MQAPTVAHARLKSLGTTNPLSYYNVHNSCSGMPAHHRKVRTFVRQLFYQRMPPSVRMVLPSASTTLTLPQLAEMADRILAVANPPTIAPVSTSQSTTDLQQVSDQLSRLISTLDTIVKRTTEPQDRSSRSSSCATSHRQSHASSPAGICWYHRKFGDRAKSCRHHVPTRETDWPVDDGNRLCWPVPQLPVFFY